MSNYNKIFIERDDEEAWIKHVEYMLLDDEVLSYIEYPAEIQLLDWPIFLNTNSSFNLFR